MLVGRSFISASSPLGAGEPSARARLRAVPSTSSSGEGDEGEGAEEAVSREMTDERGGTAGSTEASIIVSGDPTEEECPSNDEGEGEDRREGGGAAGAAESGLPPRDVRASM